MLLIDWAIYEINPLKVSGAVNRINLFGIKFYRVERILTSVQTAQREQELGANNGASDCLMFKH